MQRSSEPLDAILPGVSGEIAVAFTRAMSSLDDLAHHCRDRGLDPLTMIMTMMSGAAASGSGSSPNLAAMSDAELVQRSHDLIEALDRADVVAIEAALAPGFVHSAGGPPLDRLAVLSAIAQRTSKVPYIGKRTWDCESVVRRDDALVFTGRAHEVKGNETRGGYFFVGWYLLQWVRTDGTWRVQLLTRHKEATDRDHWNEIFQAGCGFSLDANRLLVETVADVTPGTALDLAMGQGRNALYLASRGWKVIGVDMSDDGPRIAREHATERKLELETVTAENDSWDFGDDRFDLVTLMYAGDDARWIDRIKTSLRAGGLFVVEGWARESVDDPVGFGAGELASRFRDFEILRDELVEDVPDWTWDQGTLVRFVARKK